MGGSQAPKNTEQKTLKRKKQQCFRAKMEPDVRTSQAAAKVYGSLGSYVWDENCSSVMERACFPPMKDKILRANERERDHVVLAQASKLLYFTYYYL